jgi:hypothetical protein
MSIIGRKRNRIRSALRLVIVFGVLINVVYLRDSQTFRCLTLPSPTERVLKKADVKVLSFGEDLGEAKRQASLK